MSIRSKSKLKRFPKSPASSASSGSGTTVLDSELETLLFETGSLIHSENSENEHEDEQIEQALQLLRGDYINLWLHSFYRSGYCRLYGENTPQDGQTDAGGTQGNRKHRAASPPEGNITHSRPSKRTNRRNPTRNDGDSNDGNDDDDLPKRRRSNVSKMAVNDGRVFACPFVKRYPHRYLKCFSHNLKDVSRVKFHLFREKAHRLPLYCPTCSETFKQEDLRDEHIRAATCPKKEPVKWEGITSLQRQQLGQRSSVTSTAEENWYTIFGILFPNAPLPSSPYIDITLSGELRGFREHMLTEGPRIWNYILNDRLPENLRPYLEELQSMHDSFFAEAVVKLCENWHARCSSVSTQPQQRRQSDTYLQDGSNTFELSNEMTNRISSELPAQEREHNAGSSIPEGPQSSASVMCTPTLSKPAVSEANPVIWPEMSTFLNPSGDFEALEFEHELDWGFGSTFLDDAPLTPGFSLDHPPPSMSSTHTTRQPVPTFQNMPGSSQSVQREPFLDS